ncbi:MAG: glycoside hydrolase family 3 protein, partial [Bacteroidia bacterium]|nr:glycoside hydrolase family 3 protein [Bacteroidia bacterium]
MKRIILILTTFFEILTATAQEVNVEFLNPALPIEERVNLLVSQMTLEEKIGQMVYKAPAIPRLMVPEYNWWNECLHGVA